MADLFDFTAIKDLVAAKQVSSLILLDTNVLMSNPDPKSWQTNLPNPLLIISWSSIGEIARLREKNKEDTQRQAREALDALLSISEQGPSYKGVPIQNVGLVLTLKSPPTEVLEPEIKKLLSIKEMCHGTDTTLMLIQRELNRTFPDLPVMSMTGDKLYTVLARDLGLTVYNSQQLPADLSKYARRNPAQPILDPDAVLAAAVQRLEEKATKVDLVLTGKRLDKSYVFDEFNEDEKPGAIIADGYGRLSIPQKGIISFLWSLPYKPGPPKNLTYHPAGAYPDYYCGYSLVGMDAIANLDYMGREQDVPHDLAAALTSRIADFAALRPEPDMPTLLNPLCWAEHLMKTALCMEDWEKDKRADKNMEEFVKNLFNMWENEEVFPDYQIFKQYCIKTLKLTKEDNVASFLDNVFSTWEIGYKVSFTLPPSDAL